MRKIVLSLFAFASMSLAAQQVDVLSVQALPSSVGEAYHPKLSPDGSYILLSKEDYTGLKKYDVVSKTVQPITTASGAGYGVQISDDGKNIVWNESSLRSNRKYKSLKHYDVTTRKSVEIEPASRSLSAHSIKGSTLLYTKESKPTLRKTGKSEVEKAPFVVIEDRQMVVYNGDKKTVVTPNGTDKSYFWASISPDKTRLVYVVAGKGAFVSGIDGRNPISLGHLGAPVWYTNQWIVGMNDQDNGDFVTSSTIDIIKADGTARKSLTDAKTIALFPSVSEKANKIAFATDKGSVYVITLNTK